MTTFSRVARGFALLTISCLALTPIARAAAAPNDGTPKLTVVNIGSVSPPRGVTVFPYQPYPLDLATFSIPTGDEYQAWLDEISSDLFGTAFPGFVLPALPLAAGETLVGTTASTGDLYTLQVTKIDETESTPGYVDPNTFEVYNLETVWLRGTLSTGAGVVQVEGLASLAADIDDPSNPLIAFLPLNGMYPFTSAKQALVGFETLEELDPALFKIEGGAVSASGDACQACKNDGNKKIKRMKRDLKRCLFWTGAGAVVGGIASGGAGAILVGGIGGGYCADTALDEYGDIVSDFCSCFAANDCGDHEACVDS